MLERATDGEPIWMPATTAAMRYDLEPFHVENILDYAEFLSDRRKLTREAIEFWLSLNTGDFQGVDDFHASIGREDFFWRSEESERTFWDCMSPAEG